MAKVKIKNSSNFGAKIKYFLGKEKNIFKFSWRVIKGLFKKKKPFHEKGTHIITGYPGAGKTLLMNKIIQEVDASKFFFLSNIKEFNGIPTFDINDIFDNNKQVCTLPTRDTQGRILYGVIFDEINLTFNKRLNRSSVYNNLFVGLIEFLVSHRHQGIPRIYFIGQKLELQDTQLQSLFKFQHDIIRTKRRPYYCHYHLNNSTEWLPRKLCIVNRVKSIDDLFIESEFLKIKIKYDDLKTYNTLALKSNYELLEKAKIKD